MRRNGPVRWARHGNGREVRVRRPFYIPGLRHWPDGQTGTPSSKPSSAESRLQTHTINRPICRWGSLRLKKKQKNYSVCTRFNASSGRFRKIGAHFLSISTAFLVWFLSLLCELHTLRELPWVALIMYVVVTLKSGCRSRIELRMASRAPSGVNKDVLRRGYPSTYVKPVTPNLRELYCVGWVANTLWVALNWIVAIHKEPSWWASWV